MSVEPQVLQGNPPPISAPPLNGEVPVARAVGASVRRSPWPWILVGAAFTAIFVVGLLAVIVIIVNAAQQRGGPSRVQPGTAALSSYAPPRPVVKPESPITVSVRKARMGDGYVLEFYNGSERHLLFTVAHRRPTLNQETEFSLRLDPGHSIEQGWNEGHTFYPGDVVDVKHTDFRTKSWVVNPK